VGVSDEGIDDVENAEVEHSSVPGMVVPEDDGPRQGSK
jgi:hypothetical protein